MKTEDLLRYRKMYAAMEAALGTPWLTFGYCQREQEEGAKAGLESARQLRESPGLEGFQEPNKKPKRL